MDLAADGVAWLDRLRDALCRGDGPVPAQLLRALRDIEAGKIAWKPNSSALLTEINSYLVPVCGTDQDCARRMYFTAGGQRRMLKERPEMLRWWYESVTGTQVRSSSVSALAEITQSQLEPVQRDLLYLTDTLARRLGALGFSLPRAPSFGDRGGLGWCGVTYGNALLIDDTLFVPAFGLERPEQRILDHLLEKLPEGLRLVPVPARYSLLHAGGSTAGRGS